MTAGGSMVANSGLRRAAGHLCSAAITGHRNGGLRVTRREKGQRVPAELLHRPRGAVCASQQKPRLEAQRVTKIHPVTSAPPMSSADRQRSSSAQTPRLPRTRQFLSRVVDAGRL